MDVAGLSHERSARSGVARATSSRDRRARRPHAGVVRPEPPRPIQAPAPSADRLATDVDPAAPDAADHRQADYFLRVLSQNRRLVAQRIDDYQRAIVAAHASGDVDTACSLRRLARIEEQDRDNLDRMLEKLRSRFGRRTPGPSPAHTPRPRSAVR
ncbi:hypothetical protein [Mycobacterium paraseoulense]|uniref:Uncharacterized protein n=1 Tax=Mycobacterium paraseoulense TaxID=590652 RepID=A0A1X0I634_9MYCO|nr:hypothetical protein [Mycobacterium paraseoulense]MCV7397024.1 hypothetical protein [Mycobacterium paraseoulense]ORB36401.1 hypothetical protein BST39_20495 [Mycobacterium paraseoulense]BBZ69108.1 hypothetical protein MPRS_02010 [Mycobacterium paraseoulense]